MGQRVATAVLNLTTDATSFNRELDAVEKRTLTLKERFSGVGKKLGDFGGKLTSAGGTMTKFVTGPIAGAVAGLTAMALKTSETADRVAKAAREAGLSAGAYQELKFAIGQVADVTEQQMDTAFRKLVTVMGDAANGEKTYVDALTRIGFTSAEVASGTITSEQAFMRLNQAMMAAKSPAEAASMAADLLGERVGPKLASALKESGGDLEMLRKRARDLGIVMSGDTLAAAETFQDQLDELGQQFADLGRDIAAKLLPVIVDDLVPFIQQQGIPILRKLADGVVALIDWFGRLSPKMQIAAGVVAAVATAIGPLLVVVGSLMTGLAAIAPVVGTVATVLGALATGPIAIVVGAVVGLTAAWALWGDDIRRIVGGAVSWLTSNFGPPVKALFSALKGVVVAFAKLFKAQFDFVLAVAQAIGSGIVSALKTVLAFFGVDWKTAVMAAGKVFQVAKDVALAAVKFMVEAIKVQFNRLTKIFDFVKSGVNAVTGAFNAMTDLVVRHSYVPEMADGVLFHFNRMTSGMLTTTQGATQGVTGGFAGMANSVGGIVGGLMDSLTNLVSSKLGGNGVVNSLVNEGMGVLGNTVKGMLGGGGFVESISKAGMQGLQNIVGNAVGVGGNIVNTFKQGWDAVKGLTQGGIKAAGSALSKGASAMLGTAGKFLGPAGAIAGAVGSLFGEGTTKQKIAGLVKTGVRITAGVLTGGMSELGLAAWEGVKVIAGAFKKWFTKPGADELAGRDLVKQFHTNIESMLTKQQKIEAGNVAWKQDVIFIRDSYKKLGLSSTEAEKDVLALWASSRDGAERSKQVIADIIGKLQGGFRVPVEFDVGELRLPSVTQHVKVKPMAKGGFGTVREPTLFLAGEAGPEQFAFSGANKRFAGPVTGDGAPIVINVTSVLDGAVVARNQVKHIPRALAMAGVRM